MNIENAKKRLLDSDQELSYSLRVAIVDLIDRLNTPKHETVEECVVTKNSYSFEVSTTFTCSVCGILSVREGDKYCHGCGSIVANHHGKPGIEG